MHIHLPGRHYGVSYFHPHAFVSEQSLPSLSMSCSFWAVSRRYGSCYSREQNISEKLKFSCETVHCGKSSISIFKESFASIDKILGGRLGTRLSRIYQFVTNNQASIHLWWKENSVKRQKFSKYYGHGCSWTSPGCSYHFELHWHSFYVLGAFIAPLNGNFLLKSFNVCFEFSGSYNHLQYFFHLKGYHLTKSVAISQ